MLVAASRMHYEIWAEDSRHLLVPSDYYVDANNAGEGLIVAYWT